MERAMFGVLVLSCLLHFSSSLRYCQYHLISEPKTWWEAQKYCREKHTDLATISDEQDLWELDSLAESGIQYVFVGLYRTWAWSLSEDDDYKEGELAFWNWASGEPIQMSPSCGSIGADGKWSSTVCSLNLTFFCYNAMATDISERFISGSGTKNWWDAQVYCRELHTDLARVRNQLENEQLQSMVEKGSAWIGLTGMSWAWSDGSEPSFKPWNPQEPELRGVADCGVLSVDRSPPGMIDGRCSEARPFYCYTATLRKQLVRLKLMVDDSSVDPTDPAMMESILKQVKGKLRDKGMSEYIEVSWKKLPEKEKNTKTPEKYEQKCVS